MPTERYSHVESRKREGAHYTPDTVADFISENIVANATLGKSINIVDPAVGDGELLISLLKTLKDHSLDQIKVYGFDTNKKSMEITENRLRGIYPDINLELHNEDFLQVCLEKGGIQNSADIFSPSEIPDFDLLIANPPYIRTQVLGAEQAQVLSKNFGLKGRVDIYQAFLVAMKAVLKPNGVAGVIVSNRFLTTKGAGKFREILYNSYSIKGIWDFGDTRVFEAAVLPAVMVLSPYNRNDNREVSFSSIYLSENKEPTAALPRVNHQVEALQYGGLVSTSKDVLRVKHGHLTFDAKPSDVWRLQDTESENWLSMVNSKTWCTFKDVGKIRVGVKTTADNVFIRSNWEAEIGYLPELLKPLTTHHVAGRFRCNDKKKKSILYTHQVVDGKRTAFDISGYPLSRKYLEDNREQLAGRKYAIEANRQWFEIWVPQNPEFWAKDKIIFRDITEQPTFWMDKEGTVVNGDCYWMLRDNPDMPKDILWLALAVANSQFIEEFYDIKFQNKLYSNKRRFITQYVEQFPIPDPSMNDSLELIVLAQKCYLEKDGKIRKSLQEKIDLLVWSVFDVPNPSKPGN